VADSFVPVIVAGTTYNIDNEILTIAGVQVYRQRTIIASPTNPNGKGEVSVEGAQMVSDGGLLAPFRIPSTTSTGVVIKGSAGRLCRLINPGVTGMGTVKLLFYDDPAGGANNLRYTWNPQPGDVLNLQIACVNGISVIPSAATTFDVLVEFL
jgi:hypothetical protein